MANIIISNIYYMLTYAFQVLKQSNYDNVSSESFDNVHDLFAAILSKGIAQQLKQGLHREYIGNTEEMYVLRGKLDINGTIKSRINNRRTLSCEYDELSENNIFNQIIKVTVAILLREESVREETKSELKKEMIFFSEVEEIDPLLIRWDLLRFDRNNQSYRMLLSICQFVHQGLLLTTESGDIKLAHFLDEQRMCRLYERFILEYYRKHYPQLKPSASKIGWALDDGMDFMLPTMKSDIMLTYEDKTLIIDAKYYKETLQNNFEAKTIHSNNLYQIFAYVKNKANEGGEVSGMLLYAKTTEEIQPNNVYKMSGNKISVRTLDLNCSFAMLSGVLDGIAEDHFGELIRMD